MLLRYDLVTFFIITYHNIVTAVFLKIFLPLTEIMDNKIIHHHHHDHPLLLLAHHHHPSLAAAAVVCR